MEYAIETAWSGGTRRSLSSNHNRVVVMCLWDWGRERLSERENLKVKLFSTLILWMKVNLSTSPLFFILPAVLMSFSPLSKESSARIFRTIILLLVFFSYLLFVQWLMLIWIHINAIFKRFPRRELHAQRW